MARTRRFLFALVIGSLVLSSPLLAQKPRPKENGKGKPERFIVVQLGSEVTVIPANDLKARQKKAVEDDRAAAKAWAQAKKEAAKNKEKFSDPKPKRTVIKKLGGPFKSKDAAEKALTALKAKAARKSGRGGEWVVVYVDDDPRIVKKKELSALKKGLANDHRESLKSYKARKAQARKEKQKFDEKPPKASKFRSSGKSFGSEDEAKAWIDSKSK